MKRKQITEIGWVDRAFPARALRRRRARVKLRELAIRERLLDIIDKDPRALAINPAAEKNRLLSDWPHTNYSANQAIIDEAPLLIARARHAVRSDGIATSIVGAFRRHVIGTGITPRSNARDPGTGELLEAFNRERDRLFYEWARNADLCDTEKTKPFLGYQRMTCDEFSTVGESFTVLNYVPNRDAVGLQLQVIEPEMLDTDITENPQNKNTVTGGVEINAVGAPVAFWIYTDSHPLESWGIKSTRITPDRLIHYFSPNRPRQVRALSPFGPILKKLWHLGMYDDYMLVRARVEACIGGFLEWEDWAESSGLPDIGMGLESGDTGLDANDNPKVVLEPGILQRLPKGLKAHYNQITTPGVQYDPFRRHQLGNIGAGVGLDGPTVTRDYTHGTFSSQQQGLLEIEKETDPIQELFIDLGFRRIVDKWTEIAILEGRLEAPQFTESDRWHSAYLDTNWAPPPTKWINPKAQAGAAKIARELDIETLADQANERGKDWRQQIRTRLDVEQFEKGERETRGLAAAPKKSEADENPFGDDEEE